MSKQPAICRADLTIYIDDKAELELRCSLADHHPGPHRDANKGWVHVA